MPFFFCSNAQCRVNVGCFEEGVGKIIISLVVSYQLYRRLHLAEASLENIGDVSMEKASPYLIVTSLKETICRSNVTHKQARFR